MNKYFGLLASMICVLAFSDTAWNYGKKCADEIGVELPPINCADGALVPVTRTGNGPGCDKPSSQVASCFPGSRILQFRDTITRNGGTETILTTVQCRAPSNNPNDDYEVAMIQHNETKNKVCWFFPGYGKSYPSPYTANFANPAQANQLRQQSETAWRGNSSTGCNNCHSSGTYLRTPWIMQVEGSRQGSFVRTGGRGAYTQGGTLGFNERVGKRGYACSVGETDKVYSPLVKINGEAFDAYLTSQKRPRNPENTAPSSTCTRCHYMGSGGSTCSLSISGLGDTTPDSTSRYPNNRWMPPETDWPPHLKVSEGGTERTFLSYYSAAIEAVKFCCNRENIETTAKVSGKDMKICRGGYFPQSPNAEQPCNPNSSVNGTPSPKNINHR